MPGSREDFLDRVQRRDPLQPEFLQAVEEVSAYAQVFAAGANCFKLAWTVDVVKNLRASKLPIVVYPNSGAEYDPSVKKWVYPPEAADFGQAGAAWLSGGGNSRAVLASRRCSRLCPTHRPPLATTVATCRNTSGAAWPLQ